MPGHSRSKNGVASLAYVPGIHAFNSVRAQDVDGRDKPGHDGVGRSYFRTQITRMTDWSIVAPPVAGATLCACRNARSVSAGTKVA
jgi:hypothetical protein